MRQLARPNSRRKRELPSPNQTFVEESHERLRGAIWHMLQVLNYD
jgi:hypothetical protein